MPSAAIASFDRNLISLPRDTVNQYGAQKHCVSVPPHCSTQIAVDDLRTLDSAWTTLFRFRRLIVEEKEGSNLRPPAWRSDNPTFRVVAGCSRAVHVLKGLCPHVPDSSSLFRDVLVAHVYHLT